MSAGSLAVFAKVIVKTFRLLLGMQEMGTVVAFAVYFILQRLVETDMPKS